MTAKVDIGSLSEEEKHRLVLEWLKSLRPCDDVLMAKVFLHKKCVECVLKPIFRLTDLELVKVETHKKVEGIEPDKRGMELDVLAWDVAGHLYNIEFQRDRRGMSIKRTRLYGDAVDLLSTARGSSYEELPDVHTVILCEFDMFKRGKPCYTERTFIEEISEFVDNGRYVKYLNVPLLMQNPNTELGRLMHDLWCADPSRMYHRELADVVRLYKMSEEGRMEFTGFMGELVAYERKQAEAQGKAQGEALGKAQGEALGKTQGKLNGFFVAIKALMRRHNWSADQAMDELEISGEERQELKKLLLEGSAE